MAYELAIFPLRMVLFPGAVAPLHIFEPRYRVMLEDCLQATEEFGISYAGEGAPGLGSTGCRVRIAKVDRLEDGRSNIVVSGEDRYRIADWCDRGTPYLVAMVSAVEDTPVSDKSLQDLAAAVRSEFLRLTGLVAQIAGTSPVTITLATDPRTLSFQVSAVLETDDETKQELLAETSTAARLRRLIHLLRQARSYAAAQATIQTEARRNGNGPHRPDLEPSL